jgi:hypothetical protein
MEKNLWENLKSIASHYRWRFGKALVMVILANFLLIATPLVFREAVFAMYLSSGGMEGLIGQYLQGLL